MMSVTRAAARRGDAGQPLPVVYQALAARQANPAKGQLTLVVGPPSAGKSLLIMNLLVAMKLPSLALLLDTDQLTAAARFGAIVTGDDFAEVRANIDRYTPELEQGTGHIQTAFWASDADDITLQMEAYEQRYGLPPDVLVVDNLGNLTSGFENEWATLKALCLALDNLAREQQCAVIAAHHMTDLITAEPLQRDKMLGKVSQYPRLIYSVGFNEVNGDYKVAVVKNSSGPSDPGAKNPVVMHAEPARMRLSENRPAPVRAMTETREWWSR
jgi:Ni2+-binding GTPase involved in maturation of urease and hydrogenase